ncbi:hypothetical protein D9M72_508490 [compost metagenome]
MLSGNQRHVIRWRVKILSGRIDHRRREVGEERTGAQHARHTFFLSRQREPAQCTESWCTMRQHIVNPLSQMVGNIPDVSNALKLRSLFLMSCPILLRHWKQLNEHAQAINSIDHGPSIKVGRRALISFQLRSRYGGSCGDDSEILSQTTERQRPNLCRMPDAVQDQYLPRLKPRREKPQR